MTGRAVTEWVGKTPDSAIPPRVRLRLFERCNGVCALTGRKIQVGDEWDIDHKRALCNGGEHRESNLQVVLREPHRKKTAEDVSLKAKAARVRLKHIGAWPKSKRPIQSRGFQSTRKTSVEGRRENNISQDSDQ